jgi:Ran GTPase-activating protein (RanGAP) involved in mRNA processing and transport
MRLRVGSVLMVLGRCAEAANHGNWCGLRHGEQPEDLAGCTQIAVHETVGAQRILDVLPEKMPLPLEQLDLSTSKIGAEGAAKLAPLLSATTTQLKDLDTSGCGLGDDGVAILAEAIVAAGNSTKLAALDLSHNDIKGDGAVALANMLKSE